MVASRAAGDGEQADMRGRACRDVDLVIGSGAEGIDAFLQPFKAGEGEPPIRTGYLLITLLSPGLKMGAP